MRSYAKLSARTVLAGNYTDFAATVVIMLLSVLSVIHMNQLVYLYAAESFVFVLPMSSIILLFFVCLLKYILSSGLSVICKGECAREKRNKRRLLSGALLEMCLFFFRFSELLFFLLPPAILGFSMFFRLKASPVSKLSLWINIAGTVLLLLAGLCFFFVSVQKYSKAVYYFAGNETVSVSDSIKLSVLSTRGSLLKISFFKFSFFPWMLSGILLLPLMFVLPYYEESLIFYCMLSRK